MLIPIYNGNDSSGNDENDNDSSDSKKNNYEYWLIISRALQHSP